MARVYGGVHIAPVVVLLQDSDDPSWNAMWDENYLDPHQREVLLGALWPLADSLLNSTPDWLHYLVESWKQYIKIKCKEWLGQDKKTASTDHDGSGSDSPSSSDSDSKFGNSDQTSDEEKQLSPPRQKTKFAFFRIIPYAFKRTYINRYPEQLECYPPQKVDLIPLDELKYQNGTFHYVVMPNGELRVASGNRYTGHVDLAKGRPVLAAGEVSIRRKNGEISEIESVDAYSGHYQPEGNSARRAAEKAFEKAGFKDVKGKYHEYNLPPHT